MSVGGLPRPPLSYPPESNLFRYANSLMSNRTLTREAEEIVGISSLRFSVPHDLPPKVDGSYVVYWMTAARRTRWNFAIQRAVGWARELKRPLVIIEVLTCGGRWDSDRHHRFVLQGMSDNARQLADAPALYYPYVEPQPGECREFFVAVCGQACVVITDDYPIAPPAVKMAEGPVSTRVERIDGSGLMPFARRVRCFQRHTHFGGSSNALCESICSMCRRPILSCG